MLETQTAIPKGDPAAANDLDQLRNLSCTNALSKILESYVLEKLQKETTIKANQYGGIKGSGTCHFLVSCWDFILKNLEYPDSAVSLLSVDFSKAFNRMGHQACLRALSDAGASTDSLQMVFAFLSGRRMRFKVGQTYSSERPVNGGSPQGTKLGNFLFIVTINQIEDKQDYVPPTITVHRQEEEDSDHLSLIHI